MSTPVLGRGSGCCRGGANLFDVVGDQGGQSDPEVDVGAVHEFLRRAICVLLSPCEARNKMEERDEKRKAL